MATVLITGVAGMIGSHLLDELLIRNYMVIGFDNLSFGKIENIKHNLNNKKFKFFQIDISDFSNFDLLKENIDIIIHLAAIKKIREDCDLDIKIIEVNCTGTENILKLATRIDAKVIFASTSDVYGMSDKIPLKEDTDSVIGPSSIKRWSYAVSKLYGEHLSLAYYREHRLPVIIIRYFGGFSHRSSFTWSGGHIPLFIDAILKDKELIIHGDGTQTRSMAYVSDLVEGTILAMEQKNAIGEIFNIGNSEEISIIDTAYLIHRVAKIEEKIKLKFIPFNETFGKYREIVRRVPDLTKAKTLLGYVPKVSFRKGIKMTIEAIKNRVS